MNWILFTEAQREAVLDRSEDTCFAINPRLVDNPNSLYKDMWVAPVKVVAGRYNKTWSKVLLDHERIEAEVEELFKPSDEV